MVSRTLYSILVRLQRTGWLASPWEAIDPSTAGRPARRYHRLTASGAAGAPEIALVRQQLSRATGVAGRVVHAL